MNLETSLLFIFLDFSFNDSILMYPVDTHLSKVIHKDNRSTVKDVFFVNVADFEQVLVFSLVIF